MLPCTERRRSRDHEADSDGRGADVLGRPDAYAEAYTSFQNSSSDEYNALASGCSKAAVGRESKARQEAKDNAKEALIDVCRSRYLSSEDCENWCVSAGADQGWTSVWSSDVAYSKINEDDDAECGHWFKYRATSACGCVCRGEVEETEPADPGLDSVTGCTDQQSKDLRAAAWNIGDDWANFEAFVEEASGLDLGSCIQSRFQGSGSVRCESEDSCSDKKGCKNGRAVPWRSLVQIYPHFFNNGGGSLSRQPDRRACYAALLAHEFAHTCWRLREEPGPEGMEDGAFEYWKDRFAVTADLNRNTDCNMD